MNENHEAERTEPEIELIASEEIHEQDDNYPGSFFRVPGTPVPGQTEWSLL
ncbi:hypothetical protein [Methylotuvimicrobium sp. KM1]|uniref:hypothetical protein n=1 Tax=Methylotuvimicrobium sp. KM1 TaxID=3377707 RepID=UPI00384EFBF8